MDMLLHFLNLIVNVILQILSTILNLLAPFANSDLGVKLGLSSHSPGVPVQELKPLTVEALRAYHADILVKLLLGYIVYLFGKRAFGNVKRGASNKMKNMGRQGY